MTINEAVTATYLKATGKTTTPSTSKRAKIIGLLNLYQRRWANEPGVDWYSLYDQNFSIGSVTDTDSYDIDKSTIRKVSDREGDFVRIVWPDEDGYTDYTIVPGNKLKDYYSDVNKTSSLGHYCAVIGDQLVFNHTFASTDNEYGGDIQVPCYVYTDEITDTDPANDEVQVDDPDWLVLACAAEYVRTDITRQSQHPFLLQEANAAMERMRSDNDDVQLVKMDMPWTPGQVTDSAWD